MSTSDLAGMLGNSPPDGIAALSEEDRRRLAELLTTARAAQATALDDAIEGGLSNIPRALRGVVRRTLFR